MKIWVLLLLIAVLGTSACTKRFVRVNEPWQIENSLKLLEQYNARVRQIKAAVAIKGTGILGHFFHEQADVIVQKPHYLLWSMRSFFDAPASLIASDGAFITIYDWSGQRASSYEKMPLEPHTLIDFFDFKIHPRFLISMLLAQIPLEHARLVTIGRNNGLLEYRAELEENWRVRAIFDEAKGVVVEILLSHAQSGLSYHVAYEEMSKVEGIAFPTLYNVFAQRAHSTLKFSMRVKRLELNGPPTPADKFYLRPH